RDGKGKGVEVWTYRYKNAEGPLEGPASLEVVTEKGRAKLSWPASASAANGYRVYRAESAVPWQAEFARVGSTRDTSFTDEKAEAGKVYLYKVTAVTAKDAESPGSPLGRTQPRVPAAPVVAVLGKDKVEVTWKPHPGKDVVGYNLYRGV